MWECLARATSLSCHQFCHIRACRELKSHKKESREARILAEVVVSLLVGFIMFNLISTSGDNHLYEVFTVMYILC